MNDCYIVEYVDGDGLCWDEYDGEHATLDDARRALGAIMYRLSQDCPKFQELGAPTPSYRIIRRSQKTMKKGE